MASDGGSAKHANLGQVAGSGRRRGEPAFRSTGRIFGSDLLGGRVIGHGSSGVA